MDANFSFNNTEVSTEAIKGIESKIFALQEKLQKKSVDLRIDVVYFIVTAVVLLIFISIIFMDTFHNLKMYFNRRDLVSRKTSALQTDDNEYPETYFTQRNDINKMEEQIMMKGAKQKEKMQPLIDLKVSNDIPDAKNIHSQISLNVLDPRFDENSYNKNDGDSFWKMLFMPPKYYELVNNRAEPYFKLQNNGT